MGPATAHAAADWLDGGAPSSGLPWKRGRFWYNCAPHPLINGYSWPKPSPMLQLQCTVQPAASPWLFGCTVNGVTVLLATAQLELAAAAARTMLGDDVRGSIVVADVVAAKSVPVPSADCQIGIVLLAAPPVVSS